MRTSRKTRPLMTAVILLAPLAGLGACSTDETVRRDSILARSESEATGWSGAKLGTPDAELVAAGRRIAERECSSCHAIDRTSVSPPQGAPPLRDLLFLNDPDWVAYRLIDAVRMGHDNMPVFDFDVRAADALIAYLETISSGGN
jgi:mono/diheme cytochrome c family protein